MFSSPAARGHGFGVNIDNFDRCVAAFATRKLIMPDWINSKDEYLVPNTEHPDYEEFVNDSVIFLCSIHHLINHLSLTLSTKTSPGKSRMSSSGCLVRIL
jgi:hypothetical protein